MKFEYDIILSYSEDDDLPIEGLDKGWVTNFRKFLVTLLTQIGKEEPRVLMISETNLPEQIENKAAVFVAVLSDNYFQSSRLVDDLNSFCEKAKEEGNLDLNGLSRLFKVVKYPIEIDEHLPEYQSIIPYDFFEVDPMTGEAKQFHRFFGSNAERSFWMKLVDMAYDISQYIYNLTEREEAEIREEVEKSKTVYLASTGVDMVIQRDVVKRELIRHGYRVLPDHSLPKEVSGLEEVVKRDLRRCRLSIHLVGEDYGYRPKGTDLSVVDIQNQVASKHTKKMSKYNRENDNKDPFSRLIWLSPDLKNVTERQKIFIEDLKSDAASLDEAEVLQITLQEFKSIIREELVTGGRFNVAREIKGYTPEPEESGKEMIYLICDKPDLKSSKPIATYLEKRGFKVVEPTYDGDLVDLRYIHQENLRRCDASIIYCGTSTEDWINAKLQDLLKAPGFGRMKPIKAKAVYIGKDKEINRKKFESNRAIVLECEKDFTEEQLEPFLQKLL
ncbi:MAG: DUF4062 domain-containing protein [bacterium]|nr:DUF4062 domain-containing protein [bacterium]